MLKKVLTGTILGLVLFVLGSAMMDRLLERQASQYQGLIDLFFPLGEKIDEMHLLLLQQHSIIDRATAADGTPVVELEEANGRFSEAIAACFTVCFAMLERPGGELEPAAELLLAELLPIQRGFLDHSRQVATLFEQLSASGGSNEAGKLAEQVDSGAMALQESVARFEEIAAASYSLALAQASAVRSSVRRLFFGLVAVAVILGTLANIFFYRLLRPVKSMVDAVRDVKRGHYEVRVPVAGGDEVAFLAGEFNAMAAALGEQQKEIERNQRFLRQSEKLSAIGELSLGVAHEVRNPLSTIQMSLNALGKRQDLSRVENERVALALNEVDRLEGLVSSLLDYGRPSDPHMAAVDVATLIEHSIDLVEAESMRCDVAVEVEGAKATPLPEIEADENQLIQVLVNLLLNAIQASSAGGRVRVAAAVDGGDPAAELVSIQVADQGVGIDPEELKRIFTPFFTTRRDGTGLGLPVARKIVEAHGGDLSVDSEPGHGTTAVLRLPITPIVRESGRPTADAGS